MLSVKNKSLSEQVLQQLFDAILRGELQPGARIKEGSLARELGVAQGTLREALQQLEHQGLVAKSNRRGTFVTTLTREDVANIYRIRIELEPLAASLAHDRLQPQDFAQLETLLHKMKEASRAHDLVERCKLDLALHQLIWALSGNPWLEKALNAVCPPLFASYMFRAAMGDTYDEDIDDAEHETLLNILRAGGSDEVAAAFRSMIEVFCAQDMEYFGTSNSTSKSASANHEALSLPRDLGS